MSTSIQQQPIIYDLFLVYNKNDSDLVHNTIEPLLLSSHSSCFHFYSDGSHPSPVVSTPLRLGFEHDLTTPTDPIQFKRLLMLSRQSESVMFIFSKNPLSKPEYDLISWTPYAKRSAMIVDDDDDDNDGCVGGVGGISSFMAATADAIEDGLIDPNKVYVLNGVVRGSRGAVKSSSASCSASSVLTMSTAGGGGGGMSGMGEDTKSSSGGSASFVDEILFESSTLSEESSYPQRVFRKIKKANNPPLPPPSCVSKQFDI